MLANALDLKTNNNDWGLHLGPHFNRRAGMMHWLWQTKFNAAKNVNNVTDKMLHACGGTGYKTDLGIERLLRDGKAGWVMGPSNEVLRQYTGKFVLLGSGAIDYWDQHVNKRVIHQELKKMTLEEKQELAKSLAEDVELEKGAENKHPFQETDFENPFHTCPPAVNDKVKVTIKGKEQLRYFSPVSCPTDYGCIELVLRFETQGLISRHFQALKPGKRIP
ncbi:Oxidoreductase FAD-binding and C-terminal Acyl-CoA dehydrogenase domains-containing protein [Homarus americanus]|uniref:Oxidoreductase FAD-binding and C-terminal Acyl-CoA dehydrogenase domains-containing protein n=1 Tax=Homarus americanus TaxID=6706 RepID=A0A8J5JNP1_HOMAM|nr:Oxidoreductase FAD-binding and C-terminal Acyl-CoA dehydrogenase domains-containing protein [Homarus americanus]